MNDTTNKTNYNSKLLQTAATSGSWVTGGRLRCNRAEGFLVAPDDAAGRVPIKYYYDNYIGNIQVAIL